MGGEVSSPGQRLLNWLRQANGFPLRKSSAVRVSEEGTSVDKKRKIVKRKKRVVSVKNPCASVNAECGSCTEEKQPVTDTTFVDGTLPIFALRTKKSGDVGPFSEDISSWSPVDFSIDKENSVKKLREKLSKFVYSPMQENRKDMHDCSADIVEGSDEEIRHAPSLWHSDKAVDARETVLSDASHVILNTNGFLTDLGIHPDQSSTE